MPLQCLQSSFGSIVLMVWEEMSFEEFQDGRRDGHLGYRNGTILTILNLYVTVMPPIKFRSIRLRFGRRCRWIISRWPPCSLCRYDASHPVSVQSDFWSGRRCSLKGFQDSCRCGHLRYRNGTILAILNLFVAPMPPTKFRISPTYDLRDVVWRGPRWRQSWISERNNFSNFESLCRSDASHQVSAQSDLRFWRKCRLKNFKMTAMVAILDIGRERF